MHIVDLGVSQWLVGFVFIRLISDNFVQSTRTFAELRLQDNLLHLRRRMYAYYRTLPRARGTMSAIGKLSMKMLGEQDKPRLKAKAAETRNLIPLLVQICAENRPYLGAHGNYIEAACVELHGFYTLLRRESRVLSSDALSTLRRHTLRFLTYWKHAGGNLTPKHHFFLAYSRAGGHSWQPAVLLDVRR